MTIGNGFFMAIVICRRLRRCGNVTHLSMRIRGCSRRVADYIADLETIAHLHDARRMRVLGRIKRIEGRETYLQARDVLAFTWELPR